MPPLPRRLLIIAVSFGVAALAGWIILSRSVPQVVVISPERGPAVEIVYATGTVEPVTWAQIAAKASGRIESLHVSEGETVAQGQMLMRLDDREPRALLAEIEARLRYWQDEVARQSALAERGIASREARDKARSEYLAAQAAAAAARQRLQDFTITAPIDGVVLRRDGEIGEVVDRGQTLFWVGQPRPLRITADIDEEDIAQVQPGQDVLIKADAFPEQIFRGRIDRITLKGDPINKTFRVRVSVPDTAPVMVGMTTEINVVTQRDDDALLIPATAITRRNKVFVIEDNVAQAVEIETGIRGDGKVQVISGLSEKALVVLDPPAKLESGETVRVIDR